MSVLAPQAANWRAITDAIATYSDSSTSEEAAGNAGVLRQLMDLSYTWICGAKLADYNLMVAKITALAKAVNFNNFPQWWKQLTVSEANVRLAQLDCPTLPMPGEDASSASSLGIGSILLIAGAGLGAIWLGTTLASGKKKPGSSLARRRRG
jgi:hypothetical protein